MVSETPNVEANRHFAAGRVWARLFKPKPGPPQSVRLSDLLGVVFLKYVRPVPVAVFPRNDLFQVCYPRIRHFFVAVLL